MSVAPDPSEIFERAVEEGESRLDQSIFELVSTSFIAGFTIVFGVVALGIVEALVEPRFGDVATVAGALAFGVGLVFLVVGRAELFNENFFDPVAKAAEADDSWLVGPLVRLWVVTFALNLVGGGLLVAVLLTLGPFDHVVVTILHVLFGVFLGANVGFGALAETAAIVTAGNLVGGLGLVTLSHVAQVKGARESGE